MNMVIKTVYLDILQGCKFIENGPKWTVVSTQKYCNSLNKSATELYKHIGKDNG